MAPNVIRLFQIDGNSPKRSPTKSPETPETPPHTFGGHLFLRFRNDNTELERYKKSTGRTLIKPQSPMASRHSDEEELQQWQSAAKYQPVQHSPNQRSRSRSLHETSENQPSTAGRRLFHTAEPYEAQPKVVPLMTTTPRSTTGSPPIRPFSAYQAFGSARRPKSSTRPLTTEQPRTQGRRLFGTADNDDPFETPPQRFVAITRTPPESSTRSRTPLRPYEPPQRYAPVMRTPPGSSPTSRNRFWHTEPDEIPGRTSSTQRRSKVSSLPGTPSKKRR